MGNKLTTLIRLIILLSSMIIFLTLDERAISTSMVLFLLLVLNMQLRVSLLKNKPFVLSLTIDLLLIGYLHHQLGGLIFLSLFITVFDGLLCKYIHNYVVLTTTTLGMVYFLRNEEFNGIFLGFFAYLLIILLTLVYQFFMRRIENLEHTYDDVRRYSYELEVAKNKIDSYSQQVEHLTILKERQRLSEEIHDTIGHRLTALNMQMEAGIRLLDNGDERGKVFLKASVDNLRESIDVLRQTVRSTMPKEYRGLLFSFEEMIRKFSQESGINVQLQVSGEMVRLYPGVEMVLFKNAQEAITNAARHGRATNIWIELSYHADCIVLIVKDDGKGCQIIKKGIGIQSMEERLKYVGGSLEIHHAEGFAIKSIIPLKSAENMA